MAKKADQKYYILLVLLVAFVAGWFYWFQWRPSIASKECIDGIKFEGSPSVEKIKIALDMCMMARGIAR